MIYKPKLKPMGENPFIVVEDDLSEVFDMYATLILRRYERNARFHFKRL